jgi:hypothetical protein
MVSNLTNTGISNYTTGVADVVISPKLTDSPSLSGETRWTNINASKQYGYFCTIPELKDALIKKTIWTIGKGFSTDTYTKAMLENISGNGKDTFQDILFNLDLSRRIYGDSYAEIIRNDNDTLINLKVLDTATMTKVFDKSGLLIRYEQNKGDKVIKFKPEEILNLQNNRVGDNCGGMSDIDALQSTIDADNESFTNLKKLMKIQAKPLILWKLKTDDTTKIANFITKVTNARNWGEDLFIPDDENAVSQEVIQLPLSPVVLEWRNELRKRFYRGVGLPELITDSSGSSEAGGKIGYLLFEGQVHREQLYIEQQLWNQMAIKLTLNPPATLEPQLQMDNNKDSQDISQPNDMMAGVGQ